MMKEYMEDMDKIFAMAKSLMWENAEPELRGKWLIVAKKNVEFEKREEIEYNNLINED